MSAACEHAHLDGAYVLGALAPAERQDFERHLAGCPICARAVRELAGLPGLLGKTDLDDIESPPAPPLPDTLLPGLVREVRRQQRRRVLATGAVAAAAAVVVTLGAVTAFGGADQTAPEAGPAPAASATAASGQEMVPVGYSRMAATVSLASVDWGTRLDLACSYAAASPGDEAAGTSYALVVHTRDGRTEQVATWRGLPGRTMRLTAATASARDQIASVEVRTADGQPVLKLTT
jgi:anti-sigma factor RsiW